MTTEITDGVKVSVQSVYQSAHSDPAARHFLFAYRITIQNLSDYTVQLLSRRWEIFDSTGTRRLVEGEGVVGQQPIIPPGEEHEYTSGCDLQTDFGTMSGFYQMIRLVDGTRFEVSIPKFQLIPEFRLN